MELWKTIDGFDGFFEVSNLGNVKSKEKKYTDKAGRTRKFKEHLMFQGVNNSGYKCVTLRYMGISKTFLVHRLVAKYFVENPHNFSEVNHKNEIKTDNRAENLEWCSRSYNCRYGSGLQKRITACSVSVVQILDGKEINSFSSMIEAQRETGIKVGSISRACRKPGHKAGGYEWRII